MFSYEEYSVVGKDGIGLDGRKLRLIPNKEGLPWTVRKRIIISFQRSTLICWILLRVCDRHGLAQVSTRGPRNK
jgi:hypothetical protein